MNEGRRRRGWRGSKKGEEGRKRVDGEKLVWSREANGGN